MTTVSPTRRIFISLFLFVHPQFLSNTATLTCYLCPLSPDCAGIPWFGSTSRKLVINTAIWGVGYKLNIYVNSNCKGNAVGAVTMKADGTTCSDMDGATATSATLRPFATGATADTDLAFGFYSDASCESSVQLRDAPDLAASVYSGTTCGAAAGRRRRRLLAPGTPDLVMTNYAGTACTAQATTTAIAVMADKCTS